MTTRLYYTDSMLREFDATVRECVERGGRVEATLDRTAFYPTSGGQPFDTGTLGAARVVDVIDRDDGEIVHVVSEPLRPGASVTGAIDWARRFDHMQQHSGQHILSAAFDWLAPAAATVSFHMSAETSTIDLAREVTASEIATAEEAANEIVWADRPVAVRFASAEDASRLPLRKEPARAGELRLVDVPDFDLSACGGTHVPRTGMIGVIAAAGWERFKGGTRVTFVCGRRALTSHNRLRDVTIAASRLLSTAVEEIAPAIERLQGDLKTSEKIVQQLSEEICAHRAVGLRAAAETICGVRVVLTVQPGADAGTLKRLASEIVQSDGFIAVVTGDGTPLAVVVARSADIRSFDAGGWLKEAIAALGGRGGGRPELAQGGVPVTSERLLAFARQLLSESILTKG